MMHYLKMTKQLAETFPSETNPVLTSEHIPCYIPRWFLKKLQNFTNLYQEIQRVVAGPTDEEPADGTWTVRGLCI